MSSHACDAVVVACIDFRFQKYIRSWLDENMQGKTYDLIGFAGSTKSLEIIMQQIDISKRLHHINEAILIHHEDCGAYGAESTHERHSKDLTLAKSTIISKYADVKVCLFYLHLDGTFEEIE